MKLKVFYECLNCGYGHSLNIFKKKQAAVLEFWEDLHPIRVNKQIRSSKAWATNLVSSQCFMYMCSSRHSYSHSITYWFQKYCISERDMHSVKARSHGAFFSLQLWFIYMWFCEMEWIVCGFREVFTWCNLLCMRCISVCDVTHEWVPYPFCVIAMCDSNMYTQKIVSTPIALCEQFHKIMCK